MKDTTRHIPNTVSLVETENKYPSFPYPQDSHVKRAILDALGNLGLDKENPFASYVTQGQTALIKPNWVRHTNPLGYNTDSLITHSSFVYYVALLLAKAMQGEGTIVIADAPLQNCNFESLKEKAHIEKMVENIQKEYPHIKMVIEDWRITTTKSVDTRNKEVQKVRLTTEEEWGKEYEIVDLGKKSFLEDISRYAERFRVTKYRKSLLQKRHSLHKHEYLIAKRVLEADFVVNLPKLKTHIKAGVTCAMKNLVGVNGHKEFLPHHIKGSYLEGGDNYMSSSFFRRKYENLYDYVWEHINDLPVFKRKIYMRLLQVLWKLSLVGGSENISAGSWMGNDTIWRTTLDLNHIVYFDGNKARNILTIVDGIIAGEGEGPLEPTPKEVGIVIAGENPAYVDAVAAKLMGYVIARIPTIYNAIYYRKSHFFAGNLEDMKIKKTDNKGTHEFSLENIPSLRFVLPKFWRGAA